MTEQQRATSFALRKAQAQSNVETHVTNILYGLAKSIVDIAPQYRTGKLLSERQYAIRAQQLAKEVEPQIENYVRAYAEASVKVLGMDSTKVVDDYLGEEVFGRTFYKRNSTYLGQFADDIVKMVKAGISLGYDQNKLLAAIRSGYQSPYRASVITKAKKQNILTEMPHRGRGIYQASYENIIRNAQNTVNLAWGVQEREYGKENGAVGYMVHRGSSYPCAICDDEVGWIHPMDDMVVPLHCSCRCYVTFVYN